MAGTSYTRQSTLTDGDTITAGLFNNEYNQIVSAFSYTSSGTTGHQHDGSAGQGGNIHTIGDQDFLNKIVVDTANNRVSFFIEVGGSAIEQVRVEDGAVVPVTDNDVDLGSSSVQFKDLFLNGTANIDSLVLTSGSTVTTILNEDNMSSDSDTALATQQSIKAYVDAQVTAQDLDLTDGTTVIAIDLDSETLSILGGTGITSTASGNGVTLAIDGTVTTLTGTQTLTNKTIDADNNTIQNLEVDNLKSGVLDTDISSVSSSDDTLPSAKAVKTYVDAQVTAQDLDFQGDSGGALNIDLDSETLTVAGGTGIDTSGATNTLTVAIDSTVATLTGTQTLTNKTLTAPTISGNLTTDGTIDGRDVAGDGTKLDGIEASATADQTDAEIRAAVEAATDSNVFTDADHTKLDGIEASADVTDTTNVTAAGAVMDSEVTNLAQVKAFDSSDYATAAQGTTADAALPKAGGAMTGAITTNSTFDGRDVATDGTKLDGIEASADVTDTVNVTAAGALMDSELTDIASVKALNQGVATTDSPAFTNLTLNGTDSVKVPSGTTAQRNGSPANGMFRYNSTTAEFEGYQDGAWGSIGGGTSDITLSQFTGDGSDTTFTLSGLASENNTFVFIDGVYQSKSNYSVSTADPAVVTFSTAPPNTTAIEVMVAAISVSNIGTPSDNTVSTAKIVDGAVTTVKIADNAVTTVKIADDAVTAAKLTSGDYDFDSITVRGAITEDAVTLTGTSTTIDLATATNFVHDLTGATTYTFSNPASTGNATAFTLKIIQDSTARAITWPTSVDWAGGTAPTLTATNNGVDVFVFYTIDGGTTYYGFTAGQAMA